MRTYRGRRRGWYIPPVFWLAAAGVLALAAVFLIVGIARSASAGAEATPTPAPPTETPVPTPTPSPTPEPVELGWELTLVNVWNPMEEGYEPELEWLPNGLMAVDKRCYPALREMLEDCRAAGHIPVVCAAYRTQEDQERLFEQEKQSYLDRGYSEEEAEAEAGKLVAVPGTSEHQLGLAVDLCDFDNQWLDEDQEDTPVQQWLMEHCWEYGFILRYPNGSSDMTGIIYEPWHYRYVGEEAAQAIREAGICLEEYLEQLGAAYHYQ